MNWPSRKEVYKHHRMLSKAEAFIRQLKLSVVLAAFLAILSYFLPAFFGATLFTVSASLLFASLFHGFFPDTTLYKNAEAPHINPEFTEAEFIEQGKSVQALCRAIAETNISMSPIDESPETVAWLNGLLCVTSLYNKIVGRVSYGFSEEIAQLVNLTETMRSEPYKHLMADEKHTIKLLNRFIIEAIYDDYAPMCRFVKKENAPQKEPDYRAQMPLSEMPEEIEGQGLKARILRSPRRTAIAAGSIGSLSGLLTVWLFYQLPMQFYYGGMSIVYTGTAMLLINTFLSYIFALEIDEYTELWDERMMLRFHKLFSYSRGWFFLGTLGGKRIGLPRMLRFLHVLIIGPTGTTKSTALIIPPLLHDADSVGSAVVPDPKSPELHQWVTGRWLKAGKKAFLFDPWHAETIGINPLLGAEDSELLVMVEVLLHERKEVIGHQDPFFKSRTVYILFYMLKMVQSFDDKYANLASLYHIVKSVAVFESFVQHAPQQINDLFADFFLMKEETRVNTLSSVRQQLDFLMDPAVRRAFSKKEFDIDMLFAEKAPCLLILGYPMDMNEVGGKIASLLINLIIRNANRQRRSEKELRESGKKARSINDLYLYLDELRFLKITGLADLVSIARGSKIQVIASATDLDFFKYYKADFTSILANFRSKAFTTGVDPVTAKYISDNLGKVNVPSYRIFRGLMLSQEEKSLMSPDRIQQMPEDMTILFSPKMPPFIAKLQSIYTSRFLKKMCEPPPKSMRQLYRQWGVATEPLTEPQLPTLSDGLYDYAKLQSISSRAINAILVGATGDDSKSVFRDPSEGSVFVPPDSEPELDPFDDGDDPQAGMSPEEQIVMTDS